MPAEPSTPSWPLWLEGGDKHDAKARDLQARIRCVLAMREQDPAHFTGVACRQAIHDVLTDALREAERSPRPPTSAAGGEEPTFEQVVDAAIHRAGTSPPTAPATGQKDPA